MTVSSNFNFLSLHDVQLARLGQSSVSGSMRALAIPAAMALLSSAPFWGTKYPNLTDYPSHLARFHVMLGSDPALAANYNFHWRLIGNLGTDLLIVPLSAVIGIDGAAFLIAALIAPLTVLAIFDVSRSLGRPLGVGALLALPLVFAQTFLLGFLNYSLGLSIALFAFGAWIRGDGRQRFAFVLIAWLIWLCHMAAWANLLVMCGGYELSRTWRPKELILRLWPLAFPGIMLVLSSAHYDPQPTALWTDKLRIWIGVLGYRSFALDVATLAVIISTLLIAARSKIRFDARVGIPALLFAVLTLVVPPGLGGGDLADLRLAPIALILAALALEWTSPIAWVFVALFAIKVTVIALAWSAQGEDYAHSLRALEKIPRGARVRVVVREEEHGLAQSPYAHFSGYAVGAKSALVNSNFAIPGVHLLSVPREPSFVDPSQIYVLDRGAILDLSRMQDEWIWIFPNGESTKLPENYAIIYSDKDSFLLSRMAPRRRALQ